MISVLLSSISFIFFFFFQAEDGIRDHCVTGVQTCALPIYPAKTDPHIRRERRSKNEIESELEPRGHPQESSRCLHPGPNLGRCYTWRSYRKAGWPRNRRRPGQRDCPPRWSKHPGIAESGRCNRCPRRKCKT